MKKPLGFIVLVFTAFYAGMWFEKKSSETLVNKPVLRESAIGETVANDHVNDIDAYVPSMHEPLDTSAACTYQEFAINQSSLEDVNRFLARVNPATDEIIALYLKADNPEVQERLLDILSSNLPAGGIELADSLIADSNPKARLLAYALFGATDIDSSDVAIQLVDASFTETDPKIIQKLVEAMANTCAYSTQTVAQQCVDRIINIIDISEPELGSDSLVLLSRMPVTKSSIAVFSEKLYSDIPAQRLTALDGLFNASDLDTHTLDSIRSIASDEAESVDIRELANELLSRFQDDLG